MNILVTGSSGFLGKNLICNLPDHTILEFDKDTPLVRLKEYSRIADVVFHFAGVNRPEKTEEYYEGNSDLTKKLTTYLQDASNNCPIVFSSTVHAVKENDYGKSKKQAEDTLKDHASQTGAEVFIYRLPNLYGKWSRPNYNSVVSTYCHNVWRGFELIINDENYELELAYIDDVVKEFQNLVESRFSRQGKIYSDIIRLGDLARLIHSFLDYRKTRTLPNLQDKFINKLYATFLSYIPMEHIKYNLLMHRDARGSFTEFVRGFGQVSVNISKENIEKGHHWHNTKNEKFLVVKGSGVIRFRNIFAKEVYEVPVSDEVFEVVDIPIGYTHSIQNTGSSDLITIMWVNEPYDPGNPDTFYLEV